jgi:hypothetical protein
MSDTEALARCRICGEPVAVLEVCADGGGTVHVRCYLGSLSSLHAAHEKPQLHNKTMAHACFRGGSAANNRREFWRLNSVVSEMAISQQLRPQDLLVEDFADDGGNLFASPCAVCAVG